MLIETHAHLDFPQYDKDREDVIDRARAAGVGIIINVSSSLKGSFDSVNLSKKYGCIYAACGIHPHGAKGVTGKVIDRLKGLIRSSEKVVAIGEVGLDFYPVRNCDAASRKRDISNGVYHIKDGGSDIVSSRQAQYDAFVKFIRLSEELKLPLILHCREEGPRRKEAVRLLINALKENLPAAPRAVIHCFSTDRETLEECLNLGLHVSFTCNVTFKNAHRLRETLKAVPLGRLLLETDAPFLAPQVKRGERNEPAYLTYLVEAIAENLDVSKEEVESVTTNNAKELFHLRGG